MHGISFQPSDFTAEKRMFLSIKYFVGKWHYDTQVVNLGEAAIRLHRKGGDLPDPFGLLQIYVKTEYNASELVRIALLRREQYM